MYAQKIAAIKLKSGISMMNKAVSWKDIMLMILLI